MGAFALFPSANAQSDILFDQMTNPVQPLIISSWFPPDGSDSDGYAYDNFLMPADASIREVWWIGGGATVTRFTVRFYTGLASSPDHSPTITALPESERSADYLKGYTFNGNANQTSIPGSSLFQYHVVLPTALRLPGDTVFWVKIEADVPGFPSWGLATASHGRDNHHVGFWTGGHMFYQGSGSEAFQLRGSWESPSAYTITSGSEFTGNLASLFTSDDDCVSLFPDSATAIAQVELFGVSRLQSPSSMTFTLEASAERLGLSQALEFYNYAAGKFDFVSGTVAPTTDTSVDVTLTTTAPNYVGPNLALRARVTWAPINDEDPAQDGWLHRLDLVDWETL